MQPSYGATGGPQRAPLPDAAPGHDQPVPGTRDAPVSPKVVTAFLAATGAGDSDPLLVGDDAWLDTAAFRDAALDILHTPPTMPALEPSCLDSTKALYESALIYAVNLGQALALTNALDTGNRGITNGEIPFWLAFFCLNVVFPFRLAWWHSQLTHARLLARGVIWIGPTNPRWVIGVLMLLLLVLLLSGLYIMIVVTQPPEKSVYFAFVGAVLNLMRDLWQFASKTPFSNSSTTFVQLVMAHVPPDAGSPLGTVRLSPLLRATGETLGSMRLIAGGPHLFAGSTLRLLCPCRHACCFGTWVVVLFAVCFIATASVIAMQQVIGRD